MQNNIKIYVSEKSRPIPVGGRRQGGGERGKLSRREATPSHNANRPRFLSKDFLRPDLRRALGPWREKARRIRGKCSQASGCPGCSLRREKVRRIRQECAQASGCLGHLPRREKACRIRGECAQASGCLGRLLRREKVRRIGESAPKPLAA